jgi:hypothetical protein
MEIFDRIAEQIDAVRLPLFAVSLTALPRANTPVLLMLHWHGFRADPAHAPGARSAESADAPAPRRPVPGSALQMNPGWGAMAHLDQSMLDAAWRLGAWDLDREERRACATAGASEREVLECRQAFAESPFGGSEDEYMLAEAPDRSEMMEMAARVGYVRWIFRPVRGGVWRDTAADDTLAADGGRTPPCPIGVQVPVGTRVSRTRYRLGRIDRIILP